MAGMVESKLTELGLTLPALAAPIANYVGFVRTGDLLFVSGQLCLGADGKLVAKGKLGAEVSIEDGQKAARACAVNLLAQIKAAVGDTPPAQGRGGRGPAFASFTEVVYRELTKKGA